jgi:hypothetical protein
MTADRNGELDEGGLRAAIPGLARIYASSWWNTAEWTLETTVRSGARLARAAFGRESASDLIEDTAADLRTYARRMLEIIEGGRGSGAAELLRDERPYGSQDDESTLRARGEELLRRSADVDYDEDSHPAYERMLDELAPDEARILRLLFMRGPQPSVDIRAGLPLVSDLVAPGRNMIGADAGVRYTDRVPAYLNNLSRLGLIWFSREPVRDRLRYQVVEAQPDVLEALRKGGRTARTVRRSIVLTPFGKDFCETCLPVDTAEFEALGPEAGEDFGTDQKDSGSPGDAEGAAAR